MTDTRSSHPLDLSQRQLSILRFHLGNVRKEEMLARQTENLDISARHSDRADEHRRAIVNVLEAADQRYDL